MHPAIMNDPADGVANRLYPERPFVGVGVVVWRDDRLLLVQRGKEPRAGSWSIPGGAQHLGETVYEAARREVLEETGIEVEVLDLVAVVDSINRDDDGGVRYHYTLVDLVAEWRSGEPVAGDDVSNCVWVTPDELDRFELWRETIRIIGLAAEKRRAHNGDDG